MPPFENSQREFNLGMVGIVRSGAAPSALLLERMEGTSQAWIDFWSTATGGVSSMTVGVGPPASALRWEQYE